MVEFGLKLEDNKVAEWSEKYIDYDGLKQILTKASAAAKKQEDLVKRRPELAEEIIANYRRGNPTPSSSQHDLQNVKGTDSASGGVELPAHQRSSPFEKSTIPEAQPLLENEKFVSHGTMASESKQITESVPRSIQRTLSEHLMSGYFSNSSYEKRIRESLKEIDALETKFDEAIHQELTKVNTFYYEQFQDLDRRLTFLVESVHDAHNVVPRHRKKPSLGKQVLTRIQQIVHADSGESRTSVKFLTDSDDLHHPDLDSELKESDSIQRAMTDLYRTAKLLHNFAIMNYTGFVKIIKKHDKTLKEYKGKHKDMTKPSSVCNEGKDVEKFSEKMEKLYADWFCDGNLLEGRVQLLPKRGDGLQMDWSQLRLGYRLGMCAVLTIWVCWDCIWGFVAHNNSTIGGRTAFPVFRACGGLVLLHWFWGISTYVWTRFRINYIYLFDFDPNIVDSPLSIFNDAVDETLVFLVCMLLYYKSGAHDIPGTIPPGIYPCFLVLCATKSLVFPLRTRGPMWSAILEVITAPLKSPTFFTIYIGDVLTSMVRVFQDIAWAFGFILSGDFLISEDHLNEDKIHAWEHSLWYKNILIPLLCLLPLWMRFNQCLRRYLDSGVRKQNLLNAYKYAMAQTVTLFGAFHPLYLMHNQGDVSAKASSLFQLFWMALFVASSLYSFTWDVFMDWGLGRPQYGFLGPRLMYPFRSYYYAVIAADLVLRSMWVLSLIPPNSGAKFELPAYLTAVSMALELFRRMIWGFFRLENEHRNNTAQFRRVDFVPLHFTTGHKHKYKQEKQHVGWTVLAEVVVVTVIVIGVSVSSVIAAQRATRTLLQPTLQPDL